MSRSVYLLVAGWVLMSAAPLVAQDAVLGQIYGNGVHAYFGQDYLKAYQLFSSAIDGHIQDPRCFYFRGLTLLKLGRPQDAGTDFQQGAKLESATDSIRAFNVARALERVQGNERSTLEQYRLEARMTVLKKAEDDRRVRYDEGLKEQRQFLQQQSEAAPAKPVDSGAQEAKPVVVPGDAVKAPGTVPADPFSTGDEGKAGGAKKEDAVPGTTEPAKTDAAPAVPVVPETQPAVPVVPVTQPAAGVMPDATKPANAAKPDSGDPFGGAATPKSDAAKPDAAKPDGGDPFGGAGPAKPDAAKPDAAKPDAAKPDGGDPFGGAATPKPDAVKPDMPKPDAAKPAVNPAADATDPFESGGDQKPATPPVPDAKPAATPAAAAPPDKSPATKPADDKKPADEKKPAGDDPFGN